MMGRSLSKNQPRNSAAIQPCQSDRFPIRKCAPNLAEVGRLVGKQGTSDPLFFSCFAADSAFSPARVGQLRGPEPRSATRPATAELFGTLRVTP